MSEGRVLSWTRVHRAPAGVDVPFVLALVETTDGLVLAVGEKEPAMGARVRLSGAAAGASRFEPV